MLAASAAVTLTLLDFVLIGVVVAIVVLLLGRLR